MKLTKTTTTTRILLYVGIFLALNLIARQLYFRLDFTADHRYTLGKSTKEILKELDDPITVTVYATQGEGVPPLFTTLVRDLQDLLVEYEKRGNGALEYEFINPNEDEAVTQEIQQFGIYPFRIQVVENDRSQEMLAFLGAVVKRGNQREVIQVFNPQGSMEYELSSAIKKLTVEEKPRIGLIQGHGEPGMQQFLQLQQELTKTIYEIDTLTLADSSRWTQYRTLMLMAPAFNVPQNHLDQLDRFLASGGRLFVGLNTVTGSLTPQQPQNPYMPQQPQPQMWDRVNTGVDTWLASKGITVEPSFLVDARSDVINVPTGQTFMGMQIMQQANFPYYPLITEFEDHPIGSGLDALGLRFASPVNYASSDSLTTLQPLAYSSAQSGLKSPPVFFTAQQGYDLSAGRQSVAVAWTKKLTGDNKSQMVVIGDGDFITNADQQSPVSPGNISFVINALDWLAGDTDLNSLRTQVAQQRPIEQQLDEGERTAVKFANFLIPILIVIGLGIWRSQRRRMRKLQWQAEDYS